VVVETETSLISLYEKIALPQQIILGKPICEIKKSESLKNIFSLNRVLMIHKYNTNQSIRFYYNKKNAFYSIPEYRNGRRHSIY
jgi:hypothetical protein